MTQIAQRLGHSDQLGFIDRFRSKIRKLTMVFALVTIWLIFALLTDSIFLSPRNLSNLVLQTATIAILSIGLVLVVVSGNLDLSLGSVAGFTGAVAAVLQVHMGMPTYQVIPIVLLVGAAVGAWHGFWIAYQGVSALIVTLGSMMIFRGALIGVTGGATIGPLNDSLKFLGQGYLPAIFFGEGGATDLSLLAAGISLFGFIGSRLLKRRGRILHGFEVESPLRFWLVNGSMSLIIVTGFGVLISYRGVPAAFVLVLILGILFHFIGTNTVFGRRIYAIGGNKKSAYLSGINITRHILLVYISMGAMTGLAGMVFTARLNAATAAAGNLFELDAVAAAVIGGCSLAGGEGTVFGAILGALVMASLDNGMSLMDMSVTYQYIIKGLILVFAVWVDSKTRQKQG